MKNRKHTMLVIAAASAAVALGSFNTLGLAGDLRWDSNGPTAPFGQDGGGSWNHSDLNWNTSVTTYGTATNVSTGQLIPTNTLSGNVAFTDGSNAIFGVSAGTATTSDPLVTIIPGGTAAPIGVFIDLSENITVGDIQFGDIFSQTVGTGANTAVTNTVTGYYSLSDFGGGQLTLNGNMTKTGIAGTVQLLLNQGLILGSGNHTIALHDSPGDTAPEMRIDGPMFGNGGITLDNGAYDSYGSLALTTPNFYTGNTTITKGRLIIQDGNGLGDTTGITTIGALGTLAFGGGGLTNVNAISVPENITVSRTMYSVNLSNAVTGLSQPGSADASHYNAAIMNYSNTTTLTGTVTLDSADPRLGSSGGLLVVQNLAKGPNAPASVAIGITGNFAGFVQLTGDNSAQFGTGGVRILHSELLVDNDNEIGGPSAPLAFVGDGYYHPIGGYATDFGTHVVNTSSFSGGITVDDGKVFNVPQNLQGIITNAQTGFVGYENANSQIAKRGGGTLNLSGTNIVTGSSYIDAGTVNITGSTTTGALRMRSAVLNITGDYFSGYGNGSGVSFSNQANGVTVAYHAYASIGIDTLNLGTGTGESSVVNISGNGRLIQGVADDFNLSDNAYTSGTINLQDNGFLQGRGNFYVGKNVGGKGVINQSGTSTVAVSGNFVLGQGVNPLTIAPGNTGYGRYYKTGTNTLTVGGEFQIGNLLGGNGTFTQNGGTTIANSWVSVGRVGGGGFLDLSGGTFTKQGGNNMYVGEGNGGTTSYTPAVIFVHNNAILNMNNEFWVGNGNGAVGTYVQTGGTATVGSWFVVGRGGGTGSFDLSSGTFSRTATNGGSQNFVSEGSNTTSYINVHGAAGVNGTMNIGAGEFWLGNAGSSRGTLNIYESGTFNQTGSWVAIGRNGNASGLLTLADQGLFVKNTTNGNFVIGSGNTAVGTVVQTGGTLRVTAGSGYLAVGETGTGVYQMNAGAANVQELDIGYTGTAGAGTHGGTMTVSGTGVVTAATALNVGGSGTATGKLIINGGSVTSASLNVGMTNSAVGTLNLQAGTLTTGTTTVGGNSTAVGMINISGGAATFAGTSTVAYNGITLGVTGAASGTINLSGGTFVASGVVAGLSTGTKSFNFTGGLLTTPVFSVAPGLSNGGTGTVSPGGLGVVGSTSVTGSYSQSTTAALAIDVAGDAAFDSLFATDPSVINGTISVTSLGGYTPGAGKFFDIFTSVGGVTGSPTLSGASASQYVLSIFNGITLRLTSSIVSAYPGDANGDGFVDINDFTILSNNFGSATSSGFSVGDFNGDGFVNIDDFTILSNNFGHVPGPGGSPAPVVPEPSSLGLLAALPMLTRRRRR